MSRSSHPRLRLGVVGLGRLWESRHRPGLQRLSDECDLVAVYDQVGRRAILEAHATSCAAVVGLRQLIEGAQLDAIYLMAPQWFGWGAAEIAARAGCAVYSALPLASDPAAFQACAALFRQSNVPFVPELARRFYPATIRLKELLASRIGAPRLIIGHARFFAYDRYGLPGPSTQLAPLPMAIDPGLNLLDWCRFVMGTEPLGIQSFGTVAIQDAELPGADVAQDYGGFVLDFAGGAMAQISYGRYHRGVWGDASGYLPTPGFQVYAEKGAAWLEMPDRIQWTDSGGSHDERLPLEPSLGVTLNTHFFRLLRGEQSLSPDLDDALAAVALVQALERSRLDERRIGLRPAELT